MREPEIYRDPTRDAALIDLSPYADWDELNKNWMNYILFFS